MSITQEIIDWLNTGNDYDNLDSYGTSEWMEFYEEMPNDRYNWTSKRKPVVLASGEARIVQDFGGEGQGDQRYVVFSVGDKFYRVDGYYASWDGSNWDDPTPYEVTPKEVTVIEYEAV